MVLHAANILQFTENSKGFALIIGNCTIFAFIVNQIISFSKKANSAKAT